MLLGDDSTRRYIPRGGWHCCVEEVCRKEEYAARGRCHEEDGDVRKKYTARRTILHPFNYFLRQKCWVRVVQLEEWHILKIFLS